MPRWALGWATGRKVRIRHQSAGSENVHEYTFCPYFIEPSATGDATLLAMLFQSTTRHRGY